MRQQFVIRNDGRLFGDSRDDPLNALGFEVKLPEIPQNNKLLSSQGVKKYRDGCKPQPAAVFNKIADVIDRFIDFDKSLASQRTMAEMVACYIIGTYFLPAFNVIGYLWANGLRGSGKTQLLLVVTELSYLGLALLAGSTYATLRDMSDYGATLGFDDAENLTSPRKTDPDKRTLLLVGNRSGMTVALKEQGPDRKWTTRHVSTFTPKVFSSIDRPDDTLASRCIVIPLVTSPNQEKSNIDPLDYELWPHPRQELIDDLWSLGLNHLNEIKVFEKQSKKSSVLMGRNLEPWLSILTIAEFLQTKGVEGLAERMHNLAYHYQQERKDIEKDQLGRLVAQAIIRCIEKLIDDMSDDNDDSDNKKEIHSKYIIESSSITKEAKSIAEQEDSDILSEQISSQKVGRLLSKMRIEKTREEGKGTRQRIITKSDIIRLTQVYSIESELLQFYLEEDESHSDVVTNVTNVTDVTEDDVVFQDNLNSAFESVLDDASHMTVSTENEETPKPAKCNWCHRTDFWKKKCGEWMCSTCHPDPSRNDED